MNLVAGRKQGGYPVLLYFSHLSHHHWLFMICTFTFTNMDAIADLFTNDDEVYKLIYSFLGYGVFFSAIDAIGTPLQGILRAYKGCKVVLYISLISY